MRALNMQALTNDIQEQYPGTTVWGKGDLAHQSSPSDHNEDDTPGSNPEQTDADSVPEHRALDVPTIPPMNMATLRNLRVRLTDRPTNRARLKYVILEQYIWRRNGGWVREDYSGAYHDHLHISGYAPDDENGARWDIWPAPLSTTDPIPTQGGSGDMAVFKNKTTKAHWALAGVGGAGSGVGNWMETDEGEVALQMLSQCGPNAKFIEIYQSSWDAWKAACTGPAVIATGDDSEPEAPST